jgi:hypothetical protein
VCCAAPALAFIQLAHQAACQGVDGARRNDEGLQKGGIPTFIDALVNGEVAPIPAVRMRAIELAGSVESRCGAVAVGRTYLLPPLSSGGASLVRP